MTRRYFPSITTAQRETVTFEEREMVYDVDEDRVYAGDGATEGGLPLAFLSEVETLPSGSDATHANVTAAGGDTQTLGGWTALINNLTDAISTSWAAWLIQPLTNVISTFMQSALVATSAHLFAKAVDGSLTLATKAALSALTSPATNVTYVVRDRVSVGDGGGGIFRWRIGDQSANITADAQGGVWIAPDAASTGASGAWQRLATGNDVWAAWFGAYPSASAATNATALQAWINYLSATGQLGRIGPGTHQTNATIIMKDGVRFKGSGWFNWNRSAYAYTDSNPTVIQGDGATLTGQNSVVFRCSQMAVGTRGDDFTAPGTSDLQDIGVEDIHFDANGAAMAAYYYRCGNQAKLRRISHSGAVGAGFFMAGMFSVADMLLITTRNTGVGCYGGQDISDSNISTNLTDEAACNALSGYIYSSGNTSHGGDFKIARGSHVRVVSEDNGGDSWIMRQTGSDASGAHWEIEYVENNTGGRTLFYYDANSANNIVTLGYRHRGSNTLVSKAPFYGDDSSTLYSVGNGAGITAANLYVYADGVRLTGGVDYTVADSGSNLNVTFASATVSTKKYSIHGNTVTTVAPDVFTLVADSLDNGPSEPSNWLSVRGPIVNSISSYINSNTRKFFLEKDGRTDYLTALQFIYKTPARLYPWVVKQTANVSSSHTGDTNETTLGTVTLPGGAMRLNGMARIRATFTYTNSGNNKTLKIKFGGTTYLSAVPTTSATYIATIELYNVNSESAQESARSTSGAIGAVTGALVTSSVNTALDTAITFTGQLANTGETITLESYCVECLPA